MAWQVRGRKTHGEEYNNNVPIEGCVITHSNCEYCETDIISVTDNERNTWYPYLGNMTEIGKNYLYSPAIEAIRKFYNVGWIDFKKETYRDNGVSFTQELGNNLVNIHSRLHVRRKGKRTQLPPWQYQSGDAYRCLCNNCFKQTYNRTWIKGPGDLIYQVTVLPHETLEQVIDECKIRNIQRCSNGKPILL